MYLCRLIDYKSCKAKKPPACRRYLVHIKYNSTCSMFLYTIHTICIPTQFTGRTSVKCCTMITIQYNIISYYVCWIPMEWDVCTPRVGCVFFTGRATRPTTPRANPKSSRIYNTVVGGLATLYTTFELSCISVRVRVHHYTIYPFSINTVTHPSSERLPPPSLLPPPPPPSSGKKISKQNDRKTQRSYLAFPPWAPFA